MTVTIYHNPRCGKSRDTLKLIQAQGIEPAVVEYLKNPPSAAELQSIIQHLGINPRQLIRAKEPEYQQAGLDNLALTDAQLIAAMVAYPKLIERPIVLANGKAVLGRPPENVLAILK